MKHGADYKLWCRGKSCLSSRQQWPHKIFLLIFSFIWTLLGSFTIQYHAVTLLCRRGELPYIIYKILHFTAMLLFLKRNLIFDGEANNDVRRWKFLECEDYFITIQWYVFMGFIFWWRWTLWYRFQQSISCLDAVSRRTENCDVIKEGLTSSWLRKADWFVALK